MRSAWRTSDSVAYEALRASLDSLIEDASGGSVGQSHPTQIADVAELRRRVLATDGFDRAAVDALRAELDGIVKTAALARP